MSTVMSTSYVASPTFAPLRQSSARRSSVVVCAEKKRKGVSELAVPLLAAGSAFFSAGQALAVTNEQPNLPTVDAPVVAEVAEAATGAKADSTATASGSSVQLSSTSGKGPLLLAALAGAAIVGLGSVIANKAKGESEEAAAPVIRKRPDIVTSRKVGGFKGEAASGKEGVEKILDNNNKWANEIIAQDPEFFTEMAKGQTPEFLWIGCADSRVVPNFATGTDPGDVFTHRNVGNVVLHTDMNCMSALEYSVLALKVKHVIVCGHSNCGAVNASLTLPQKSQGVVNCWIAHIRDVRNEYAESLKGLSAEEQLSFMCEANALRQAFNVCTAPAIQSAWASGQEVYVHAMLFDLASGKLKRLAGPISSLKQVAQAESALASKISKDLTDVASFEAAM